MYKREKVLIVNNDQNIVEIFSEELRKKRFDVLKAYNGKEAVQLVGSAKPDIILMDSYMPQMDGFEATKIIKKEYKHTYAPMVMLTVPKGDTETVVKAFKAGADDCINIPCKKEMLTARLKAILRTKRYHDELVQKNVELRKLYISFKKAQEKLIQSEKMASVCQFVAGTAHELNNPLAGIIGFSEAILRDIERAQPLNGKTLKEELGIIRDNANRCKAIVFSLLAYKRETSFEMKPVNINQLIEDSIYLVKYESALNNIKILKKCDEGIPPIIGDKVQLSHVFANIIRNAHQAMKGKGELEILTKKRMGYVNCIFKDSGEGIKRAHLRKLFDPFFTTRNPGEGIGLGLSISSGIIKAHKGHIVVKSRGKGRGATCIVMLPIKRLRRKKERGNYEKI